MLKDFSIKFIDVMIGVVLGIGFQWWAELREVWQYIAFLFVYLNLVDYWIDYTPTVKKFPLKREIDVILHTYILFMMFYIVYSTQLSMYGFFLAFILYRLGDLAWIWRMKTEYRRPKDTIFLRTWARSDWAEILCALVLINSSLVFEVSPIILILIFVLFRTTSRILASVNYKQLFYQ